jgi:hypothetical protein
MPKLKHARADASRQRAARGRRERWQRWIELHLQRCFTEPLVGAFFNTSEFLKIFEEGGLLDQKDARWSGQGVYFAASTTAIRAAHTAGGMSALYGPSCRTFADAFSTHSEFVALLSTPSAVILPASTTERTE